MHAFTVICAWCHRIMRPGLPGGSVTHTICQSCVEWSLMHGDTTVVHVDARPRVGELALPAGYFGDAIKH